MNRWNLTRWALENKNLVFYFMGLLFFMGVISYWQLGRREDPDFVIRQMVITSFWPGASARMMEEQVADPLERKLQDLSGLDFIKSSSRPGQSVIYVTLKDTVPESAVRPTWLDVRNMMTDMKKRLPPGVTGPECNDRFDDVFGSLYALSGKEFNYEELRKKAEYIRRRLLQVPDVKKIDLLGVQTEVIYIEVDNSKLASLGVTPQQLAQSLRGQTDVTPAGKVHLPDTTVHLRVSNEAATVEELKAILVKTTAGIVRLGDLAQVKRGFSETEEPQMYYNGQPAIGIAISMEAAGNILHLGEQLEQQAKAFAKELPLGMELHQVANQPRVVKDSIGEFVTVLGEAVLIVLLISFLSLGVRSGVVVALCIPLVLAGTFWGMKLLEIDLHKISLGALIISLGLLVDDAMIVIELMKSKMEQGWNQFRAACFAYQTTAFPMLAGTVITCAGFIPIGLAKGNGAEFVGSIFAVVTVSLLFSWLISVTATPLLGFILMKENPVKRNAGYQNSFYQTFRRILIVCLTHRRWVLGLTIISFWGSLFLFHLIPQEFFPASIRPELLVELTLPEGSSLAATRRQAALFARQIQQEAEVESYSYYVGQGAPRFVLTLEPVPRADNFAEFVIVAHDLVARKNLEAKVDAIFAENFPEVRGHRKAILTGPPSPYPIMLRVSGDNHQQVRQLAEQVQKVVAAHPQVTQTCLDWNEQSKILRVTVDQKKARQLGLDSAQVAKEMQMNLSGLAVADFCEGDRRTAMVLRMTPRVEENLAAVAERNLFVENRKVVPLGLLAQIGYEAEDSLIWRRNLQPTITVQADTVPGASGNMIAKEIYLQMKELRDSLSPGYRVEVGGALERSQISGRLMLQPVPLMLVIIFTCLMLQLQRLSLVMMAVLMAPLGLIGVSLILVLTQRPVGFVVDMGILALSGMIIRNAVILIDQIKQQIKAGEHPWEAVIGSAVMRLRPILLTAAAAIFGMIPLMDSHFWGPMAVAIAGGLLGATLLTLVVLPVLYVSWFRIWPPD